MREKKKVPFSSLLYFTFFSIFISLPFDSADNPKRTTIFRKNCGARALPRRLLLHCPPRRSRGRRSSLSSSTLRRTTSRIWRFWKRFSSLHFLVFDLHSQHPVIRYTHTIPSPPSFSLSPLLPTPFKSPKQRPSSRMCSRNFWRWLRRMENFAAPSRNARWKTWWYHTLQISSWNMYGHRRTSSFETRIHVTCFLLFFSFPHLY